MMRSPNYWAVALRRYNGDIVEVIRGHRSFASRHRWARLPIIRGAVALVESLIIGFRALGVSAHYAAEWHLEDEEGEVDAADAEPVAAPHDRVASTPTETDDPDSDASPEHLKPWQIAIAFVFAFGFTIGVFKLIPLALATAVDHDRTSIQFAIVEGTIRIAMFCGYLALIGFLPDMKRVFQYHSSEHKTINTWEADHPLDPKTVNGHSRIHVRCGTAFLLWVFVVAIFVFTAFAKIVHPNLVVMYLSRIVLLPPIAGISFELIRLAGKRPNNRILRTILAPGLWLQRLTTRECDEDQCEVAIRSLTLVLDREYPDQTTQQARIEAETEGDAVQVMA